MSLKALKFFLGKKWLDRRRCRKEQYKFLARRLTKKKEKVGAMNWQVACGAKRLPKGVQ